MPPAATWFVEAVSFAEAVPPGVRLRVVELNDRAGPGAQAEADNETGPAKPLRLLIVTMVEANEPVGNERVVGLVEIVKSGPTRRGMVRNLFAPPLLAVRVTLYSPGGVVDVVEMVTVEDWVPELERVTLDGFTETVGPGGDTAADNDMVPLNPPTLVTVRVDVVVEPGETDR